MKFTSFFIVILYFFSSTYSFGECSFKTGDHIRDLNDPSKIKLLEINTPKSGNYVKNFLKIALSNSENIPPELKKRFNAKIIVHYTFGQCRYDGTVRQSGDWKDHIDFKNGGVPIRSLDVKMKSGNIMSSVHFKLLLPETRNSENEILASLILKRIGIISPETFSLKTNVNGNSSVMLFQENARKELLERNFRRESAVFEGDEDIIWSFKNFKNFELEPFALSRQTNINWFMKGISSRLISLKAYSQLQNAYLRYTENNTNLGLYPNFGKTLHNSNFVLLMLAMNGGHALAPHNRKYYYNAITSNFEPIYYDGDIEFGKLKKVGGRAWNDFLLDHFHLNPEPAYLEKLFSILNSLELKNSFLIRTNYLTLDKDEFFSGSVSSMKKNIMMLMEKINSLKLEPTSLGLSNNYIDNYMERMTRSKFSQKIIRKIKETDAGYLATYHGGEEKFLSVKDLSKIISKNLLQNNRHIYLRGFQDEFDEKIKIINHKAFIGTITTTKKLEVIINSAEKKLTFIQSNPSDWALIKFAELDGWTINFIGIKALLETKIANKQRFNEYGLTGCLTVYDTTIKNSIINVVGGECEDSLNFISAKGNLRTILIDNAFADAVDMDFSLLDISEIKINEAGNDCIDVSSGEYNIRLIDISNCKDKGVSVGEASKFFADDLNVTFAKIGVSTKDFSKANILKAEMDQIEVCAEVMQKKQEFGGAVLKFENLKCEGLFNIDSNSSYVGNFN